MHIHKIGSVFWRSHAASNFPQRHAGGLHYSITSRMGDFHKSDKTQRIALSRLLTNVVPSALLIGCAIFVLGIHSRAMAADDPCALSSLPHAAQRFLETKYPDWQAWKRPADSPEMEDWTKEHPRNCPGIASGYFESRAHLSHAILLVPKHPEAPGYKLIVLSKQKSRGQDTYRERIIWEDYNQLADYVVYGYMYTVPPGTYEGFDEPKRATIRLDGFVYRLLVGRATILHYWHQGDYSHLTIGE